MGHLGVSEPLDESMKVEPISKTARIFDKNSWEDVSAEEAYVKAILADGSAHKLRMRVTRQIASGACEARALSVAGQFSGDIVTLELYIEGSRCGLFPLQPLTVPRGQGVTFLLHVQATDVGGIGV